jgi:hypothetical protein
MFSIAISLTLDSPVPELIAVPEIEYEGDFVRIEFFFKFLNSQYSCVHMLLLLSCAKIYHASGVITK